jgi:hypothetical protein
VVRLHAFRYFFSGGSTTSSCALKPILLISGPQVEHYSITCCHQPFATVSLPPLICRRSNSVILVRLDPPLIVLRSTYSSCPPFLPLYQVLSPCIYVHHVLSHLSLIFDTITAHKPNLLSCRAHDLYFRHTKSRSGRFRNFIWVSSALDDRFYEQPPFPISGVSPGRIFYTDESTFSFLLAGYLSFCFSPLQSYFRMLFACLPTRTRIHSCIFDIDSVVL